MSTYSRTGKLLRCAILLVSLPGNAALAQEPDDAHHTIDEVIVSAAPLKRSVEQLAQPTTVLFGDELTTKQAASIGETVSREPGVSSTYFGPVASRPVIRGQFGERVRVLSNGLDSLDASALSEDHQSTVDSILAERIEIVRGPATLMYGSGAAGGLVNIVDSRIARSELDDPVSGSIALGADSALQKREVASQIVFGSELIAVSADYMRRDTGDVEIPGFAESYALRELEGEPLGEGAFGTIPNTDSSTQSGALAASLTSSNGYAGLSVSLFDSEYGVPGHAHEEADGLEEEEEVRIDLEQQRVDLQGEYEFEGFLRGIRFRAARNDYTHTELESGVPGTVFENQGTDGRVEFRHRPLAGVEGALGVQFKRLDFDAMGDEAFVPPSVTTRSSIFLFEEIAIGDALRLQGSARVERQDIETPAFSVSYNDDAWGGSLGIVWQASDAVRVAVNSAFTERHPTSTELYADGPHIAAQRVERGSVTTGSGLLKKEESRNLDLTLHGDMDAFEWTVTGFINRVNNYVVLQPTGLVEDELPVFDYMQADAEFKGIEAEARMEIVDTDDHHLHIRLFTDIVEGRERDSGAFLPRITPQRFGVGLHYTVGTLQAGIESLIVARQIDVAENELPTDGYVSVNIDLSYRLQEVDLLLFLRGTNLTDVEARQHSSPLKDLAPLPGRSLHAGLRYDF